MSAKQIELANIDPNLVKIEEAHKQEEDSSEMQKGKKKKRNGRNLKSPKVDKEKPEPIQKTFTFNDK